MPPSSELFKWEGLAISWFGRTIELWCGAPIPIYTEDGRTDSAIHLV